MTEAWSTEEASGAEVTSAQDSTTPINTPPPDNTALIVGIVVGSTVFVLLVTCVVVFCIKSKRVQLPCDCEESTQRIEDKEEEEEEEEERIKSLTNKEANVYLIENTAGNTGQGDNSFANFQESNENIPTYINQVTATKHYKEGVKEQDDAMASLSITNETPGNAIYGTIEQSDVGHASGATNGGKLSDNPIYTKEHADQEKEIGPTYASVQKLPKEYIPMCGMAPTKDLENKLVYGTTLTNNATQNPVYGMMHGSEIPNDKAYHIPRVRIMKDNPIYQMTYAKEIRESPLYSKTFAPESHTHSETNENNAKNGNSSSMA